MMRLFTALLIAALAAPIGENLPPELACLSLPLFSGPFCHPSSSSSAPSPLPHAGARSNDLVTNAASAISLVDSLLGHSEGSLPSQKRDDELPLIAAAQAKVESHASQHAFRFLSRRAGEQGLGSTDGS